MAMTLLMKPFRGHIFATDVPFRKVRQNWICGGFRAQNKGYQPYKATPESIKNEPRVDSSSTVLFHTLVRLDKFLDWDMLS
jgi:hypothetical protein